MYVKTISWSTSIILIILLYFWDIGCDIHLLTTYYLEGDSCANAQPIFSFSEFIILSVGAICTSTTGRRCSNSILMMAYYRITMYPSCGAVSKLGWYYLQNIHSGGDSETVGSKAMQQWVGPFRAFELLGSN